MSEAKTAPAPLVAETVDLRNYPYTPIFRARLFGSEFHAHASDGEWRAGVTLWLKAWDQVPAGSLPADDLTLCRLAELGRDVRTWRRVKARALHGWVECSDGRLYHPVVAEGVNAAWETKEAQRQRTELARVTRQRKRLSQGDENGATHSVAKSVTEKPTDDVTSSVTDNVTASNKTEEKGKERKGREGRKKEPSDADASSGDLLGAAQTPEWQLFSAGKRVLGANAGGLIAKALKAVGVTDAMALVSDAEERQNPKEWFAAALKARENGGSAAAGDMRGRFGDGYVPPAFGDG